MESKYQKYIDPALAFSPRPVKVPLSRLTSVTQVTDAGCDATDGADSNATRKPSEKKRSGT